MWHPRFIVPPEVQCFLAILKVTDDTVGEASLITATPPFPPSFHFSFSPSFLSCVLISLLCGSWYVDFIKFSSGWVTEKRGKDQGVIPSFLLSSVSSLSFPQEDSGCWVLVVKRWPKNLCPFWGGQCIPRQLPDSIWRRKQRRDKRSSIFPLTYCTC